MNLKTIHNVYFLGIGGIGMSGLARYFKHNGKNVAGYDKTLTGITSGLQQEGIEIHYEDTPDTIPKHYKDIENTLVVYTPAIPKNNTEFKYFEYEGFRMHKRAEVLGWITKDTFCFAVAGTHGKTTVSSILAHLLRESGVSLTAFLGGIAENFNSNFLFEGNAYTVVEADEFDRSFLHLSPDIACITSTDADHLDIYGNVGELKSAFNAFTAKIKPGGSLLVKNGLPLQGITYGINDNADYTIRNIRIKDNAYIFDIITPDEAVKNVTFNKPGQYNLLNALAAFSMAVQTGISATRLASALATFKGVERRFSYHIKTEKYIYIDDYAHHPTEINAVHDAIREMHPDRKILAVFQPHLYSRTRDFADEFAASLAQFDAVVLLAIYPAREQPVPGITSEWLFSKIQNPNKKIISKNEIITTLKQSGATLLLTIGAGDIGEEVKHIKNALLS